MTAFAKARGIPPSTFRKGIKREMKRFVSNNIDCLSDQPNDLEQAIKLLQKVLTLINRMK